MEERARSLGVSTRTLEMPRLRRSWRAPLDLPRVAAALAALLRSERASLLIVNTVRAAAYGAAAVRMRRAPLVWYMRDLRMVEGWGGDGVAERLARRWIGSTARLVVTPSEAVSRSLPFPTKTEVIHNGLDLDAFGLPLDGAPFRRRYDLPDDALLVGTVGRLRPWKGQQRFLRAMAPLVRADPRLHLVIVGGSIFDPKDGYAERLQRLARTLDLSERTLFTGHLDDVRPAVAALDLFVHAGGPEPFGRVLLEAMAMEKTVVGFADGALPEIVEQGVTGRLVEPGDEAALGAAVADLMRDPERRAAMGRAGRRRVEESFTAQRMAERFERAIRGLAGDAP